MKEMEKTVFLAESRGMYIEVKGVTEFYTCALVI
jgi:hypothetical protein